MAPKPKNKNNIKTNKLPNAIPPNNAVPVLPIDNNQTLAISTPFMQPQSNISPEITTPQDLRKALSSMSPISGNDDIKLEQEEPEDPESRNFLASLIAQGVSGFGTGLMGGSAQDIMRSGNMFNQMRETDINRQNRLAQNELFRSEKAEEKKERQAELKKREEQAKSLTDPNSDESKKKREVYRSLGYKVGDNFSAADLENPLVMQTLKSQMEQSKLATMPRQGGGVAQIKEEKRKDPTEAERLSLGFAKRTESSNKMLNNLEDKFLNKEGGFSPSTQFGYAPERFKSSERKNYEAAQKDFIGAVLRKESGASISDEEFQREAEKFFPLAGDDQQNIQFKQLLRKQAINNLKTSANIRYVKDNQTGETVEIDPFGNVLRRYKE